MSMLTKIISLLPAALLAMPLQAAAAENADTDTDTEEKPLWEWNFAAFGRYGPAYPASEDNEFNLIPLPFPVYRGKILKIGEEPDSPIKGRLFKTDRIKLDFALDLNFSSDSEDIEAREGMPDLDFVLEFGPELELQFNREPLLGGAWYFTPQAKFAISFDGLNPGYEGIVFSPEFQYRKRIFDGRSKLKFKITPSFATSGYMDYYYTVAPEFATPRRDAYSADAGYLGTELGASWRHELTDSFDIVIGASLALHQGAANEDSPLFTDDVTTSVFAAFLWKFWESERTSPDPETD